MKKHNFRITLLILIVALLAVAVRAQPYDGAPPLATEKIKPNATQISGVTSAAFSPSGKWLVLQTDVGFYILPGERLDEAAADFENLRYPYLEGQLKGFLPSEKIVFAPRRGLYTVDPVTVKTRPIYQMTEDDAENGRYLADGDMVVVSENLIISGDGDYDMGLSKGSILKFDVKQQRVSRGAKISSFYGGLLSPSGNYVLYERRGELTTSADYYDILRNVNYSIPERFNFKRHFPKYKKTDIFALAWTAKDKFIVAVDEDQFDEQETSPYENFIDTPAWLVLLDAASGKAVWKKQLKGDPPVSFQPLGQNRAFIDTLGERYEISLADGRLKKLPAIDGASFTLGPDKKSMAYLTETAIFVSAIDGANKRSVFQLPESWQGRPAFEGKGVRTMFWAPDGKRLLVFDEKRLLIISL